MTERDEGMAWPMQGNNVTKHPFIILLIFLGLSRSVSSGRNSLKFAISVKFSAVIHLTFDNYYLRGFGFVSSSIAWGNAPIGEEEEQ